MTRKLPALAVLSMLSLAAHADVKLPAILSDNMCLQANHALPIWGKADPGEQVTVTLQDQKQSATAGADGKWSVTLKALQDNTNPLEMTVGGKNEIHVKNILVGQVWVASGQSNMEFGFNGAHNVKEEQPKANYPKIRIFNLKKKIALQPQDDCEGKWEECTPETVMHTSAVGYFFARDVHAKLGVPVGLIHTSWGGTPAEAWTSVDALEASPEFKNLANSFTAVRDHLEQQKAQYETEVLPKWKKQDEEWKEKYGPQLREWQEAVKEAKDSGKPAPPRPQNLPNQPRRPDAPDNNPNVSTVLYNGMIAPIVHYAIEGAIWYQGESNAGRPKEYQTLFPAMIEDWRKHWSEFNPGEKDFPFLFVQLANFMARENQPTQSDGGWPGLREAQHMTLAKLPNTGEAVIIDVGQANDIHPKDKMDVGHRLALAAFKIAYGQHDVIFSGPTFQSMSVDGDKIRLKFANVGAGLTIASAPSTQPGVPPAQPASDVKGFSIAADDKHFVWAQAKLEGPDTIVVWRDDVPHPAAVRYAWANNPEANLYNKEGLPASPFRTDTWASSAKH